MGMEGENVNTHSLGKRRMGVDVPPPPWQHLVTDFFKPDLIKLVANATKLSLTILVTQVYPVLINKAVTAYSKLYL